MLDQIIIVMLLILLLAVVASYLSTRSALEDIHQHVFEDAIESRQSLFSSALEGWREEAAAENARKEKQKARKKKDAK